MSPHTGFNPAAWKHLPPLPQWYLLACQVVVIPSNQMAVVLAFDSGSTAQEIPGGWPEEHFWLVTNATRANHLPAELRNLLRSPIWVVFCYRPQSCAAQPVFYKTLMISFLSDTLPPWTLVSGYSRARGNLSNINLANLRPPLPSDNDPLSLIQACTPQTFFEWIPSHSLPRFLLRITPWQAGLPGRSSRHGSGISAFALVSQTQVSL